VLRARGERVVIESGEGGIGTGGEPPVKLALIMASGRPVMAARLRSGTATSWPADVSASVTQRQVAGRRAGCEQARTSSPSACLTRRSAGSGTTRSPAITDRSADQVTALPGGLLMNHSTMSGMCCSKSPGCEKFKTPAGAALRFSKSCVMPAGIRTNDPFGASNQ
jgi:hypothetical protein